MFANAIRAQKDCGSDHGRGRAGLALAASLALLLCAGRALAADEMELPRSDGARTPVELYQPDGVKGCPPLAVLSPGMGGNDKDLAYLARALSSDGWRAIVMGHQESGRSALRSAMRSPQGMRKGMIELLTDTDAHQARMMDLAATLKWADAQCTPPYKALLGHSMGAATTMLEAGARNEIGIKGENRFDAYVALSPQGVGSVFPQRAWSGIRKPVLIMTGTRDSGLEGTWQSRTQPYEQMPPGCKWLGVIRGASHLDFAGDGLFAGGVRKTVVKTVLDFLDTNRTGRCGTPPEADGLTADAK